MIAMVRDEPARCPRLYDADDLPWIGRLLDLVEASIGQPWRVLAERVERAPLDVHPSHRAAMLQALRRVLAGAGQRTQLAQTARARACGAPEAGAPAERRAAADPLGATPDDVDSLLWIDLAMERLVTLPRGRPAEAELAAFANLERIQRCVRRAHDLRLRVWDQARALVRAVARHGLIAQISRDGDATTFDLPGPLALFHSTMVYGRALSSLVPLLADHPRFELEIHCQLRDAEARVRITPPVLLPAALIEPQPTLGVAEQLARDLAALGHAVERDPPWIEVGGQLLFPDLALDVHGTRWLIEVIGFSTPDYLATKLAGYRAAGIRHVKLCVDLATAPGCELEAPVCGFSERIDVDDLLASLVAHARDQPDPPP